MSVPDEQDDFIFRPQQHLDAKWLNPDLQEALHNPDALCTLFNSLLLDREIYFDAGNGLVNSAGVTAKLGDSGKYYCGLRILTCTCCDGLCGPHSGCACPPCSALSAEEELRISIQSKQVAPSPSHQIMDDLKWKQDPGPECLQSLMEALIWEQRVRAINTAVTCPFISQIRRLIVLCNRHLVAVIRDQSQNKEIKRVRIDKKPPHAVSNRALSNVVGTLNKAGDGSAESQEDSEEQTDDSESAIGLARVGARAALRLALSLVRRAWRCGEDADVCSALLRDALDAVRALPDAGLFAGTGSTPAPRSQKIWAEVVDSAAKFLHQVVIGEVGCNVPQGDWRTSLCVWVELCARRAELPALLKAADVLVTLPPKQKRQPDNRIILEECTAPLGPFLRRMAKVTAPNPPILNSEPTTEPNLTEMFLKDLNIPSGDGLMGVRKAGIALLCHLDRLGAPLLPPLKGFVTCTESAQEVVSVGSGPLHLGTLRIQQIACAEKLALLLTHDGAVYTLPYDNMTPQLVPGLESKTITQISCHPAGRHYLCCSSCGGAWSWGSGDDGRLGHGDTAPRDAPAHLHHLAHHEVVRVTAGAACRYRATQPVGTTCAVPHAVGRGRGGLVTTAASDTATLRRETRPRIYTIWLTMRSSELLLGLLAGGYCKSKTITQISCHPAGRHYLCCSSCGGAWSWGSGDDGRLGHGDTAPRDAPAHLHHLAHHEVVRVTAGAACRYRATPPVGTTCAAHHAVERGRGGLVTTAASDTATLRRETRPHIYTIWLTMRSSELLLGLLAGGYCKSKTITQISCHPAGRHYLCCSSCGGAWSWGSGDDGRLGHGDTAPRDAPAHLHHLAHHEVVRVTAGAACSAVITSRGALYTWGRGAQGRLGHGTIENCLTPQPVSFNAHNIERLIDVALGWGEAQTLCCTWEGAVQVFGDTEGGVPRTLTSLSVLRITRVYTGEHWHAVLTDAGQVYTWGKGEGYRLGHGNLENVKIPKALDALQGIRVVDLSLGSTHGVALTAEGALYAWGTHERAQITRPVPQLLQVLNPAFKANGVSSGPAQILVWSEESPRDLPSSMPFVIDLSESTFKLLERLLRIVVEQSSSATIKEVECMAISCLNLLRLQVQAWQCSRGPEPDDTEGEARSWCNGVHTALVALVEGRAGAGAATAARRALAAAWPLLLPTPQVRAHHLITLLPQGSAPASAGARFMTELLVWSLLGGGGLRDALRNALQAHSTDAYNHLLLDADYDQIDIITGQRGLAPTTTGDDADTVTGCTEEYQISNATSSDKGASVPLMHLVKHLIRNTSCQTQMQINAIMHGDTSKTEDKGHDTVSPSCDLLIRFQRLLFCEAMWSRGGRSTRGGVRALITQYIELLAEHVQSTLSSFARAVHRADNTQLIALCELVAADIVGRVVSELGAWVGACAARSPCALADSANSLVKIARACDDAAKSLPSAAKLDADLLGWPGLVSKKHQLKNSIIRK
ncbi:hypothetical protein PYW07_014775 [Mythimna separata]|uniref:E3 ubiquitin-protein ligase HERC2 n=1 Tax=Mythimna separata TaxID=271217 RepID=A0AAD7Z1I5_MYTSE|nr:hypothetical protein PYW07_014775 [Mythimna separata]